MRSGSGPTARRLAAYRAGQSPRTASVAATRDRGSPGWTTEPGAPPGGDGGGPGGPPRGARGGAEGGGRGAAGAARGGGGGPRVRRPPPQGPPVPLPPAGPPGPAGPAGSGEGAGAEDRCAPPPAPVA